MDELGIVLIVELEQSSTRIFKSASCIKVMHNPTILGFNFPVDTIF